VRERERGREFFWGIIFRDEGSWILDDFEDSVWDTPTNKSVKDQLSFNITVI
jgi:hypothetical protein